jgi:hypothetical protein
MEDRVSGKPRKTIADAVAAFQALHEGKAAETKRKYKRIVGFFLSFCADASIHYLDQVSVEVMDRYSIWRAKTGWAWIKEVELLLDEFIDTQQPEFERRVTVRKGELASEGGFWEKTSPELTDAIARNHVRSEMAKDLHLLSFDEFRNRELPQIVANFQIQPSDISFQADRARA